MKKGFTPGARVQIMTGLPGRPPHAILRCRLSYPGAWVLEEDRGHGLYWNESDMELRKVAS